MINCSLRAAIGVVVIGSCLSFGCRGETTTTGATGAAGPRTQWGEPDLTGVWQAPKLGASTGQDSFNLTQLEGLYRPDARAKLTQVSAKDDPTLNCEPAAFPQAAMLGWPIQIVQRPGMMILLTEAFTAFRNIPTDGKGHLSEDLLIPFFGGDSSGTWDGDTLVVDVISFREAWLASSKDKPTQGSAGLWPASDALHVVERWRRVDGDTLTYQARVEDPTMLTAPWETPTVTFKRQPVDKIQEVKCLVDDPVTPPPAYLAQFGR